ncbi:cytochrome P450, partial [Podospora australis]
MSLVDPQLITTTHLLALATCLIFSILLYKFSSPPLDPREPPVLRPKFPVIGHLLGLSRHGVAYFDLLRQSQGSSPVPAATLPILNGKVYALWDLSMIHSAMRNKNLTFDVLSMEFAQRVFGLSNHGMEKLWGGPEHDIEKSAAVPTMRAIKPAMQGANLLRMNMAALRYVSEILNSDDFAGQGLQVENLYKWLRHFMTMATAFGIYGEGNPIKQDEKGLVDALWEFESNMQPLFLGVAPQIVARKAYKAREKVQKVLIPWYKARMDDAADVSEIAKVRANTAREFGFPAQEVGRLEMALLFVGTTNTIPSLYLFLANVWLRPELKKEVREEVRGIVSLTEKENGKRTATIKIQELEEKCPVLVSCYREAIRLGN